MGKFDDRNNRNDDRNTSLDQAGPSADLGDLSGGLGSFRANFDPDIHAAENDERAETYGAVTIVPSNARFVNPRMTVRYTGDGTGFDDRQRTADPYADIDPSTDITIDGDRDLQTTRTSDGRMMITGKNAEQALAA